MLVGTSENTGAPESLRRQRIHPSLSARDHLTKHRSTSVTRGSTVTASYAA